MPILNLTKLENFILNSFYHDGMNRYMKYDAIKAIINNKFVQMINSVIFFFQRRQAGGPHPRNRARVEGRTRQAGKAIRRGQGCGHDLLPLHQVRRCRGRPHRRARVKVNPSPSYQSISLESRAGVDAECNY